MYFYPRPPRGGRPKEPRSALEAEGISIHALREEGDFCNRTAYVIPVDISIHALREEGDTRAAATDSTEPDFYPRPPRGGRRFCKAALARSKNFYPRPPRGGRPGDGPHPCRSCAISIHALREEGDGPDHPAHAGAGHFYPRPPRGGRPTTRSCQFWECQFLSTPSARRATGGVAPDCE